MLAIRNSTLLLIMTCLLINGHSQSHPGVITSDTIFIEMKKTAGFGPSGNSSIGQSPISGRDEDSRKLFPVLSNKPENLEQALEYYFIMDDFQFYYQNYCAGKYDRAFFFKRAEQSKWNLADTVHLSREPVLCGFSVYAGFNTSDDPVYVIDANANNDFSDDAIRPLTKGLNDLEKILAQSVPVKVSYFRDGKVLPEEILVFAKNSDWVEDKLEVSFMFPEFRYSKFTYEGQSFLICMDAFQPKPTVSILPDEPRFTRVSDDQKIEINQFVQVGDMRFQFIGRSGNGDRISLVLNKPASIATDRSKDWGSDHQVNREVISSQVGYKAPEIKGVDIVSKGNLSTDKLRGKYVYLDFWSTSCGPCIADFKHINEVYSRFDRDRFEIIGVVDERRPGRTFKRTRRIMAEHQRQHVGYSDHGL